RTRKRRGSMVLERELPGGRAEGGAFQWIDPRLCSSRSPVGRAVVTLVHGQHLLVLPLGGHHPQLRGSAPGAAEEDPPPVWSEGGLLVVGLVLREAGDLSGLHVDGEEIEGVPLVAGGEGDQVTPR